MDDFGEIGDFRIVLGLEVFEILFSSFVFFVLVYVELFIDNKILC